MSLALFDLTGKTAIVTGSGRGLGRALALGLATAGARVVTSARTIAEAEAVAGEIEADGGAAMALRADVSKRADCEALVAAAVERFGRLDVMVCNAAVAYLKAAEDTTDEEWDSTIDIGLKGAFFSAVAAARRMTAQGAGGSIVMTSSNASVVGFPDLLVYNAAKGGLDQLVRTMAIEWGPRGIRVNAFNPGYIARPMTGMRDERDDPWVQRAIAKQTPLGRAGRLEEFVGPALFLASDAASFVSGVTLVVDGGYCAL